MAAFSEAEAAYLAGQRLGRLCTIGPDGGPQVRPVGFTVHADIDAIDIGGMNMTASRKWKNVQREPRVAFVVDDLATVDPWRPRGVEVRGLAEPIEAGGGVIRIHVRRVLAWGIETDPFSAPLTRDVR
jgi:pyridoxamine 5'-phosphate oxidase family protein